MRKYENNPFFDDDLDYILQQYHVLYPDESEINRTIEALRPYVPSKKRAAHFANLKNLLYRTAVCMNFTSVSFWVISAVIYAIGLILTVNTPIEAYKTVFILAPLPFVFSLLEVFRGREEGVLELELSCRISPQEIVVSRIWVAGAYNTILNIGLSLAILSLRPAVIFGKITFFWLLPMLLTGGAALWLCSRIKSIYAVPATLSLWFVCAAVVSLEEQTFEKLLFMKAWVWVMLLLLGIALFVREIVILKKQYGIEREAIVWN
jgi:hypothetical protein